MCLMDREPLDGYPGLELFEAVPARELYKDKQCSVQGSVQCPSRQPYAVDVRDWGCLASGSLF